MGSHKPESLKAPPKPYGKIALSLSNCLLPEEKLNPTPSMIDGLDPEVETDLRIIGCELIQTAGILLKLPQVSMISFFMKVIHCIMLYLLWGPLHFYKHSYIHQF